jgi:3-hydroxybutyryl-CoA dehydrogenase
MESISALRRIAVIGAGRAGLDFALRCASAGFDVILEDVMPSRLLRAEQAHANQIASGALHLASTVEDAVRSADLAIDFVPDELESKLEIFSLLDRMAPPRTLLCTPTTALSISDLASCTCRPELCFALQLSNTDPNSAHLVRARHSSSEATAAVESWLRALGFLVTTGEDQAEPMLKPARPVPHTGVTP